MINRPITALVTAPRGHIHFDLTGLKFIEPRIHGTPSIVPGGFLILPDLFVPTDSHDAHR